MPLGKAIDSGFASLRTGLAGRARPSVKCYRERPLLLGEMPPRAHFFTPENPACEQRD